MVYKDILMTLHEIYDMLMNFIIRFFFI